jgi:hypothetical protein
MGLTDFSRVAGPERMTCRMASAKLTLGGYSQKDLEPPARCVKRFMLQELHTTSKACPCRRGLPEREATVFPLHGNTVPFDRYRLSGGPPLGSRQRLAPGVLKNVTNADLAGQEGSSWSRTVADALLPKFVCAKAVLFDTI